MRISLRALLTGAWNHAAWTWARHKVRFTFIIERGAEGILIFAVNGSPTIIPQLKSQVNTREVRTSTCPDSNGYEL